MQRFLRGARRVAERARKRGEVVPPQLLERMESRYDELVQEALDYPSGLPPLPAGGAARNVGPAIIWPCGWNGDAPGGCFFCSI